MNWNDQLSSEERELHDQLRAAGTLPRHVAIIMDGNGRWARERGMSRVSGHREGVNSVREIVRACGQIGIEHLTLYAFSTENWKRPTTEVTVLMGILQHFLRVEEAELNANNVRLATIGNINALPKGARRQLHETMERLSKNTGLTLTLALSYSGRWDILRAVQTLALDVRRGAVSPEDISEERFRSYMSTRDLPDPDLLIRTSGELRLSNFLLWEMAYAEIHIASVYWPDFRRPHLYEALHDYLRRERRFGMTGEQLIDADRERPAGYLRKLLEVFTRERES